MSFTNQEQKVTLFSVFYFENLKHFVYRKLILLVSFHMKGQVITSRERSCTKLTFERFLSCMFSVMSCQLIGPCELPLAALPRALVRFLTGVGPLVSLQVRALGVYFVTILKITLVNFSFFQTVTVLSFGTVGLFVVDLFVHLVARDDHLSVFELSTRLSGPVQDQVLRDRV